MVLFIVTRDGFEEMKVLVSPSGGPVWVDVGVLSEVEIQSLRDEGVDLSTFTLPHTIDQAVRVIAEHHSGERIWVEMAPASNLDGLGR